MFLSEDDENLKNLFKYVRNAKGEKEIG